MQRRKSLAMSIYLSVSVSDPASLFSMTRLRAARESEKMGGEGRAARDWGNVERRRGGCMARRAGEGDWEAA